MPNIIGTIGNDTITPDSVSGCGSGGDPVNGRDSILGIGGADDSTWGGRRYSQIRE